MLIKHVCELYIEIIFLIIVFSRISSREYDFMLQNKCPLVFRKVRKIVIPNLFINHKELFYYNKRLKKTHIKKQN